MTDRIYALFSTMETAVTAINEVMKKGVFADHISVITRDPDSRYAKYLDISEHDDVEGDEGAAFGSIIGALTGLGVALIPGFGPVFATGPLAAALLAGIGAGAGAVTGGITASLVEFGASEEDVKYYERVLRDGGALVIVEAETDVEEDIVENTLAKYRPLEMED